MIDKIFFQTQLVDRLVKQLKQGTASWQQPSKLSVYGSTMPFNPITNKRYKGTNAINLLSLNYKDQRWMTYDQAIMAEGQVRRGEKGTPIEYWKFSNNQNQFQQPEAMVGIVFNAEQIDGLAPALAKRHSQSGWARLDNILLSSHTGIQYENQKPVFYDHMTDRLCVPNKDNYIEEYGNHDYYKTLIHGLMKWTSHSSRLNLESGNPVGSEGHAKEHLRDEISKMFLGDELGLGHDEYLGFETDLWIKILQKDPLEICRAASDAEKIQDYILSFDAEYRQIQKTSQQTQPSHTLIGDNQNQPNTPVITKDDKMYVFIPYEEKEEGKSLGARWDPQKGSWYIPDGINPSLFDKWEKGLISKQVKNSELSQQNSSMTPRQEFTEALRNIDCLVDGQHPIMNGQKQRLEVNGDKQGQKSGLYIGYLDGHPAGFMKNFRTGAETKWRSKSYVLTSDEKNVLQADVTTKIINRTAQNLKTQEDVAQRVHQQTTTLQPIASSTPYLRAKGIEPQAGVFTDRQGQDTYVPAIDAQGKQWTTQYIKEDGRKLFAKGGRKAGCFHVVGGFESLATAPTLVISEGYATAASVSQALGYSTVAAFDAGNLKAVANALHEKYPDKPVVIAGDDD